MHLMAVAAAYVYHINKDLDTDVTGSMTSMKGDGFGIEESGVRMSDTNVSTNPLTSKLIT